jgi:hypothetical protein
MGPRLGTAVDDVSAVPVPLTLEDAISAEWLGRALVTQTRGAALDSVTLDATVIGLATKAIVEVSWRRPNGITTVAAYVTRIGEAIEEAASYEALRA